jgi:transposase-like protein
MQEKRLLNESAYIRDIVETFGVTTLILYKYIKRLSPNSLKNSKIKRQEQLKEQIKELLDTGANKRYVAKILNMSKSNLNHYIKFMEIETKRNETIR